MSECCICFESEGAEPLECCNGFLHERCKQQWFLETRNCPLCRSFECRPQAAPLDLPPEVPRAPTSDLETRNRELRERLVDMNESLYDYGEELQLARAETYRLQERIDELQAQNTEYWNDQIEDQELEEELQLTRAERDRLRDAVGQSDLIIARQRNALMFHNQQTAMLNTQTMMLYQSNASLTLNVNQLREAVRVLQAENDQLRAEHDRLRAQLAETDRLRAQLRGGGSF